MTISPNFVAMPRKAAAHIQNNAPGPPYKMAVETPTMLPLPTQLAREAHSDWTDVQPFFAALSFCEGR